MAFRQASRVIRVFVDSSVLIAAAISAQGFARDLLVEGFRGHITLQLSTFVLRETERNLQKKRPAGLAAFASFQATLMSAVVDPPAELVQKLLTTVEPKDAPIVAAALYAQADYLATYDQKHLLQQKEQIRSSLGLEVATPDEVLTAIRGERSE